MKDSNGWRWLLRFLVILATPFILIFGGAGLFGLGLEYGWNVLVWAGGLAFLAGLVWCLWLVFLEGGSFWGD